MKKLFLPILFTVLSSFAAHAQGVLTPMNGIPAAGTAFKEHIFIPTDSGTSGANVTWDFSNVVDWQTVTANYATCSELEYTYCDSFQDENLVEYDSSESSSMENFTYEFYNLNSGALQYLGEQSGPNDDLYPYQNKEDLLRFPFTYNDAYIDTFQGVSHSNTAPFFTYGTNSVTCDGYGTLKLPMEVIDSVLRIHEIEITGNSFNQDTATTVPFFINDRYIWYSTNRRGILLMISYLENTVTGDTTRSARGIYYQQIPTAVNNISNLDNISVSPNPANGVVNIRYNNTNGNNVLISITDVTGREVAVINGTNSQQVQYNTSNLQAGIYFVRLQTDNGTVTKKLEVL